MKRKKIKNLTRERRKARVKAKISGTGLRPRLSVFRSLNHIYTQLIDDAAGKTLVSARDSEIKSSGKKVDLAEAVGKLLAEKAIAKGIKEAVFDKGAYKYHGRVSRVAEGARANGLKI